MTHTSEIGSVAKIPCQVRARTQQLDQHFLAPVNLVPFAPKRRWFQFSLATLFVAMTVLCCWLGLIWKDRQVVQERAAVIQFLNSYKLSNGPPAVAMLHDPRYPALKNPKPLPAALARLGAEPVLSIRIPSEVFRAKCFERASLGRILDLMGICGLRHCFQKLIAQLSLGLCLSSNSQPCTRFKTLKVLPVA